MPVAKVVRLPAGQHGIADRGGVADDWADLLDRQAQDFGRHHPHRGARAADVGIAGDHHRGAVLADVHGGGGFAADVNQKPTARPRPWFGPSGAE